MLLENYGDDIYIYEEQVLEQEKILHEFTTLHEFSKLPSYEQTWLQKQLYDNIKLQKNDYLKNKYIKELSNSLMETCDDELVISVYNDILDDPCNTLPLQLLSQSEYNPPPLQTVFLEQITHPIDNLSTWVDKNTTLQHGSDQPTILAYPDIIFGIQKMFNKNDLKHQIDIVYHNGLISRNETVYFDQQGVRIREKQVGKLLKVYTFQKSSNTSIKKTKLCQKLSKRGLVHSFLKLLSLNQNKQNVSTLLYECLLFESQEWCNEIVSQSWFNNLIQLSFTEVKDPGPMFHQVVYDNLKSISDQNFTFAQTDQLLLRLHQYFEASFLELKQSKIEKQAPKKVEEAEKTPPATSNNKQKGNKPKGIGYGDITYTQQYNNQAANKKKEISLLDSDKIYATTENLGIKIQTLIFKQLQYINLEFIHLIQDSCLIPVIKSQFSSLSKTQSIGDKYEMIIYIFKLMNRLLVEETLHLFTCKDYGNLSLFEVLQKVFLESNFQQNKDTQQTEITEKLQIFYNKLVDILKINKYVEIKYEESEEQQIQDPNSLYPIIMKPLVLKTSEVTKQAGWKKQMGEYYSTLSSTPSNNKMTRIIKELSEIGDNLPLQVTNSIFLRYDKDRMDAMQTLIMGSSGTPYAHGAFLYNLLFCDDYPSRPPKCLLETTGHGKVRFNPNLYNCGKVCLSLLGTWGDNWDAKQSTLLQILVSIQAMVMSEYVYYNEPGWESSMGTPEGEKNNRGYCNIVKLANIRYAMIEQLQKPPQGFEEVIQKSFYLRKDAIIKEVQTWIDEADLPVSYACTQNHNISQPFSQQPSKFKTVLVAEFDALKKELEKLKVSITHEGEKKIVSIIQRQSYFEFMEQKQKIKKQQQKQLEEFLNSDLPVIDVSENQTNHRQFDTSNSEVQNLMSRYIGVMGLDSVNKQSQASVLIYGLGALGIETAKNLVLSGLKRLTIIDGKSSNQGQFFVQQSDVSRLEQSYKHLQGLNPYVQIDYATDLIASIKTQNYQVVCLCEIESLEQIQKISDLCREFKIGFILSQILSVFGRVFVDLGEQFTVNDIDGEQIQEFIVEDIQQHESIIQVKGKHNLSVGDVFELKEVISDGGKTYNGQQFTVKRIINKSFIQVEDLCEYGKYVRNGRGQTIKQKVTINNKEMKNIIQNPLFDSNFILDEQHFGKINQQMNAYCQNEILTPLFEKTGSQLFPPQAAYLGGIVCQEIIKAITHKYMPIRQCYFHSCEDLLDGDSIIGDSLAKAISECKLLMIGAGAIGCELLKNYAMIGLGNEGKIIVTDPDVIEKSNLSRQFLFREKHIRQPKSYTAANSCLKMNPKMKIVARLDKISQATEQLYGPVFQYVDVVTNALDNVQARLYVDQQCIEYLKPLLESGTLGPKGHVQVILPNLTESYGSKQDPEESVDIPYCTLKMFPEDSNHCLEWARDKFEKLFTTKPQQIRQALQFKDLSTEALEKTLKFCQNRPKSFSDCVAYAVNKFYKYFNHGIMDLLKAYPLDHIVNGKLFWSSPKRPPQPYEFRGDEMQVKFVISTSKLYAQAVGIEIPSQVDFDEILSTIKPKEYKENKEKLQQIQQQVQKDEENKVQDKQDQTNQKTQQQLISEIIENYKDYYEPTDNIPKILKSLDFLPTPIQFEKDEDDNNHVNFIQAALNCRAHNYGLENLDWLTTKLKAGRIVPAMATTTACIAGLQTIELVKVLKKKQLNLYKNTFLNLAIPYALQSEPGECEVEKVNGENISFWSRWNVKLNVEVNTLQKFMAYAEERYQEKITCIKQKAKLLYSPIMFNSEQEKLELLQTPIYLLFEAHEYEQYVELDITFKSRIKCRFYY